MSSMRNAVQRRNHRERAQPTERNKWGILEKPKDYKLRAADHKHKRQKIKHLQQKASERNEDEFYFGMVNSESRGGVKVAKRGEENSGGAKVLGRDVVDLMKTQDVGYLRTVLQRARKEREALEREVVNGEVGVEVGSVKRRGRKVFGEDGEDLAVKAPQQQDNSLDDLDGLDGSSDDEGSAESGDADENLSVDEKRKKRKVEAKRRKLRFMKDRERDLTIALQEVEAQRAKMNGTVGSVNKQGTKFKIRGRKR